MYVCLCLCLSLFGREVTVGSWLREVTGKHGSNFLSWSAIEFIFWDHGEKAVLIQILAGRSRNVTGANFWPLGRRLNFSSLGSLGNSRFGPNPCLEVTGGHGRLREVTGGYGRLRRRKTEESGGTAGNRLEKN